MILPTIVGFYDHFLLHLFLDSLIFCYTFHNLEFCLSKYNVSCGNALPFILSSIVFARHGQFFTSFGPLCLAAISKKIDG